MVATGSAMSLSTFVIEDHYYWMREEQHGLKLRIAISLEKSTREHIIHVQTSRPWNVYPLQNCTTSLPGDTPKRLAGTIDTFGNHDEVVVVSGSPPEEEKSSL